LSNSILISTKKILGMEADYKDFDLDIVTHINSVFSTLTQLGVGPVDGFMIKDETPEWAAFIGDNKLLNPVKTYAYLRVRLLFDPPTTSYLITALTEQVKELEWRLNVLVDTRPRSYVNADGDLVWMLSQNDPFPAEAKIGDIGIDVVTGEVWRNVE
jgi:hypothetical protein